MANKSQVNIDPDALEEFIISLNKFKFIAEEEHKKILRETSSMLENESLSGGDGDQLRESFQGVADASTNLYSSLEQWVAMLDQQLEKAYGMKQGTFSKASAEAMAANKKTMGILKNATKK